MLPSPRILLRAPTGSGKSTHIAPFLDQHGWGEKGLIIVVQPRRLAARLLAGFVAKEMGCPLGQEVGFIVRFQRLISPKTRIVFVTDGILERWLTEEPLLPKVSAIIFDEFHERRMSSDLSLARTLSLQEGERPDLGIIVMSATLEVKGLAEYLGKQCSILEAKGKMYPVDIRYSAPKLSSDGRGKMLTPPLWEQASEAVRSLISMPEAGDILVFMPGAYEIRRTVELLESQSWMKGKEVYALHGQLSPELQNAAVQQGTKQRVIVSTNVAETSLTIQGVRSVVDTGVAREASWDTQRGMDTLHIVKISAAQADQRTGRAGRLGPGICIRLWSQADHARRGAFNNPEVLRVDLSSALLSLLIWGAQNLEDIQAFPWLDAPNTVSLERSWNLLCSLGAVHPSGGLSEIGAKMSRFPLPPRLARLMVAGHDLQCLPEMAAIAALLQSEHVGIRGELADKLINPDDYTDFQREWRAVETAESLRFAPSACSPLLIMGRAAQEARRSYEQLLRISQKGNTKVMLPSPDFVSLQKQVVYGLIMGFADQVGVRNGIATNTARIVGKRNGKITSGSTAYKGMCFVAAEITEIGAKTVETQIRRCTHVSEEDLQTAEPNECSLIDEAVFDTTRRRVILQRKTLYKDLCLISQDKGDAPAALAAPILAEKITDGTLPLSQWDHHVEQWILRLHFLRRWMPELELPSFDEEDKILALSMLCDGAVSYKEIKDRPVLPILEDWISDWQRQALLRYAPYSIPLNNGSLLKIRYRDDLTPIGGLKVQQLFGVQKTPLIADGRCPVTIEILAPNHRPWTVTNQLPSFWETGYPQMKKDLAGRYPRHNWMDISQ